MLRVGRASLNTPNDVPFSRERHPFAPDGAQEKAYEATGREHGATAQASMAALEAESLRLGAMWCEDSHAAVPAGHYELRSVTYEKPRGAPQKRPWSLGLVKKNRPWIVLQAEDNYRSVASVAALASADEAEYVAYTATASEVPVLRLGMPPSLVADYDLGDDPGSNLILNPGFETYTATPGNPDSWTGTDGARTEKETSIVRSGANSVKHTQPAVPETLELLQTLGAGMDTAWGAAASAWFRKSTQTVNPLLRVRNTTDAVDVTNDNPFSGTTTGFGAWSKLGVQWAPTTGKLYQIQLYQEVTGSVAGDIQYWDDVELRSVRLRDVSGNGNHAPFTTQGWAFPKMGVSDGAGGKCFHFEDQWAQESVFLPDLGVSGSMDFWMRVQVYVENSAPGSGSGRGIVLKGSTSGSLGLYQSQAGLVFHGRDSATGTAYGVTAPLRQNEWVDYVWIWDYTNLRTSLYIDGVHYATNVIGSFPTAPPPAGAWRLGGAVTGAGNTNDGGFQGKLRKFAIGRGTLTAAQVVGMRAGLDVLGERLNLPAGSYKVLARVQSRTTVTQRLRAALYDLDAVAVATGAQATVGAGNADAWVDVDLGTFTVPDANDQANYLEVTVQANGDLNPVWIDRVQVVPT